jgi:superfamily II DNA or RNA helicase
MYESQIKNHIIASGKQAHLWSDTPRQLLIANGLLASHNDDRSKRNEARLNPLRDTGVDIIQVEPDGSCTLVQCKNGYKDGVTYGHLAGFMNWLVNHDKLSGDVYYTHKVSRNLTDMPYNPRLTYIKIPFVDPTTMVIDTVEIKPHQYQLDAVNDAVKCFKSGNRGILAMPCGTGKTFVSNLLSKDHEQLIILSPLKQNTKQNLNKFIEYGYAKENTLLVDSDGERDIDNIKKFIGEHDSFLMSATFCSIDVIRKVLPFMKNPFIIVDEFHNLSKSNVMDMNDDFYGVLNSEHNVLFMSATPRVYEMEGDTGEDGYNQRVFGPTINSISFREAIEKKYICDYKIWLPSISSLIDVQLDNELGNELSINDIDPKVKDKCNFLLLSLSSTGSMKCIIYCADTKEIAEFIEALNTLNKYHQFEYDVSQITCSNSEISRKEILSRFSTSHKRQLLFSVRILDEGIDIPSCDSIFITYPSKNKIRTIQRLNRCTRIDKANPFKIGNIFLWCDEYDEILGTLCELKEYDPFFGDK